VVISIFPSATNGIPHWREVLTSNLTETVELQVVSVLLFHSKINVVLFVVLVRFTTIWVSRPSISVVYVGEFRKTHHPRNVAV
jgi:hypothetical protein